MRSQMNFVLIYILYIYMVLIFFKIGPYIWDNIGQEWEASLESKVELVELNYKCVKESSGTHLHGLHGVGIFRVCTLLVDLFVPRHHLF